jgi:hypothetical protein
MRAIGSQIFGHDLKCEGVFHVLISTVGWHVDGGRRFFSLGSLGRDRAREAPWPVARVSSSASYGARNEWGLALRYLEDKGGPFCKLTAKEMVQGEWTTTVWFGRCLTMVRTASGGAPALRSSTTASPCSRQAPPSVNCFGRRWIELVRWLSSCARVWALHNKIWWIGSAMYWASWSYL